MTGRVHVVWDWNGTLVDDRATVLRAAAVTATEFAGREITAAEVRRSVGANLRDTLGTLIGEQLDEEGWHAARDRILVHYRLGPAPPLVASARPTLQALSAAGHHQSVLSNWPHAALRRAIRDERLGRWFVTASGAEDAQNLDKAARLAALRASLRRGTRVLVVGDTLGDAIAAARVGASAVVCTRYSLHRARVDEIRAAGARPVHDIADVLAVAGALREEAWHVDRQLSA
jgi:phosphoglycolate phosphatase-like HAD superfamily hydrolase